MTVSAPASASEGSSGTKIVRNERPSGTPSVQMCGTAISRKFRRLTPAKTAATPSAWLTPSPPSTCRARAARPPASGKTANVLALESSAAGLSRRRRASVATVSRPIATAGAGPRTTMARTSAMNDPVRRMLAVSIAIASEAIASAARRTTRPIGSQSEAREVITAPASDAARSSPCVTTRVLRPITPRLSAHLAKSLVGAAPRARPGGPLHWACVAGQEIASCARVSRRSRRRTRSMSWATTLA